LQGLASHGGAIGILLALWWYARKKKLSYLHVLDRIVILVALTGAFIRLGNYFNSEIIGKPTNSPIGVVFANHFIESLISKDIDKSALEYTNITKSDEANPETGVGHVPLTLYLFFKPNVTDDDVRYFAETKLRSSLAAENEFFYSDARLPLKYNFIKRDNGGIDAKVEITGIARHPAQLYESISCVVLFLFLFWIWLKHNGSPPDGRIFGIFLVVLWGLRFSYEFLKENQVAFENALPINMGQILSIPLFIAGIIILARSYRKA
jgi:prolipoprotein diacylglyceryltransferase